MVGIGQMAHAQSNWAKCEFEGLQFDCRDMELLELISDKEELSGSGIAAWAPLVGVIGSGSDAFQRSINVLSMDWVEYVGALSNLKRIAAIGILSDINGHRLTLTQPNKKRFFECLAKVYARRAAGRQ